MEMEHLEQVKELIDRIADSYDLPSDEQTAEMRRLTGNPWDAKELQELCCEYWSHHSLEETAYFMFHEGYPPVREVELVFWRYKSGVVLDDREVYEKYRLGRGKLKALEALPLDEIIQDLQDTFSNWKIHTGVSDRRSYRFECLEPAEYWSDTHFWVFEYGRETEARREHQMLRIGCHNMSEEQIRPILACMERFQCPLHLREERNL